MVVGQRALAGLGLGDGDPGRLRERAERRRSLRVAHPAAGDDQRALGGADQVGRPPHERLVGERARDDPVPLGEELLRELPRFGLHVLRQRDAGGPDIGRVGEDAHRAKERRGKLLGSPDAVPEPAHRPERVVDRRLGLVGALELLEHRSRAARGEDVARQEQHRQPVHRGERGARDHVGRPGPDRRRARPRREPVGRLGVAGGDVNHRLLVPGRHVAQPRLVLEERLAEPRDVPVAEDAEDAREERPLLAVAHGALRRQEPHDRLTDREPHRLGHDRRPWAVTIGTRGSPVSPAQAARIHAWAGSSLIAIERTSPGPARTFRYQSA